MWWPETPQLAKLLGALALAGLTTGCFQPLYGDKSATGGAGIVDKLSSVEVAPIDAPNGTRLSRVGVEVRNGLMFGLTGGGPTAAPNYKLDVRLTASQSQVIVDINTARPDYPELRHRRQLHAERYYDRQDGRHWADFLARVLRHSRPAAALRRRPRLARRREPRRQGDLGQHPLSPGVVFRGGDVILLSSPRKRGPIRGGLPIDCGVWVPALANARLGRH